MSKPWTAFNYQDYHLKKFNMLLILSYEGMSPKSNRLVRVVCDCGKEKVMELDRVRRGGSKSCGCVGIKKAKENAKHGLWKSPLYQVWVDMKGRCYNKNAASYKYYGLRGVVVCDEWRSDFKVFHDWCMENNWKKGLQIDKDIKGDGKLYGPNTCMIVTPKENARAHTHCHRFTINGETKTLGEWCEIYNASHKNVYNRVVESGWSIEKALDNSNFNNRENYHKSRSKLTDDVIKKSVLLRNSGNSWGEVSKKVGVSETHLMNVINKMGVIKSDKWRGAGKLNQDKADQIRAHYSKGQLSQKEIGDIFGVSKGTIQHVISNKNWKK